MHHNIYKNKIITMSLKGFTRKQNKKRKRESIVIGTEPTFHSIGILKQSVFFYYIVVKTIQIQHIPYPQFTPRKRHRTIFSIVHNTRHIARQSIGENKMTERTNEKCKINLCHNKSTMLYQVCWQINEYVL